MRRDIRALAISLTAGCFLAGCGWFHSHKHDEDYKTGVQERPLEVPPDLDKPNTTGALVIPDAGTAAPAPVAPGEAAPTAVPGTAAAPATGAEATAPVATAPATAVVIAGDTLHVADTVDSTWNRVGLAMEHSGAATILARDEAGRTYDVQTAGQVVSKPGWFKKAITLGMAKGKTTAQVRLKLRVMAEGDGSKVTVEGATDDASKEAAQALLATIKSRLS